MANNIFERKTNYIMSQEINKFNNKDVILSNELTNKLGYVKTATTSNPVPVYITLPTSNGNRYVVATNGTISMEDNNGNTYQVTLDNAMTMTIPSGVSTNKEDSLLSQFQIVNTNEFQIGTISSTNPFNSYSYTYNSSTIPFVLINGVPVISWSSYKQNILNETDGTTLVELDKLGLSTYLPTFITTTNNQVSTYINNCIDGSENYSYDQLLQVVQTTYNVKLQSIINYTLSSSWSINSNISSSDVINMKVVDGSGSNNILLFWYNGTYIANTIPSSSLWKSLTVTLNANTSGVSTFMNQINSNPYNTSYMSKFGGFQASQMNADCNFDEIIWSGWQLASGQNNTISYNSILDESPTWNYLNNNGMMSGNNIWQPSFWANNQIYENATSDPTYHYSLVANLSFNSLQQIANGSTFIYFIESQMRGIAGEISSNQGAYFIPFCFAMTNWGTVSNSESGFSINNSSFVAKWDQISNNQVTITNQAWMYNFQAIQFTKSNYSIASFSAKVQSSDSTVSTISIPILLLNLDASLIDVQENPTIKVSSEAQELELIGSHYKSLIKVIHSYILQDISTKLSITDDVSELIDYMSSLGVNENNVNNITNTPNYDMYSLSAVSAILISAIKNGNYINILTSLYSNFPLVSIPSDIYSTWSDINDLLPDSSQLYLSPQILNDGLNELFSEPNPFSFNKTSTGEYITNQSSQLSVNEVKYIMSALNEGALLINITSDTFSFIQSFANVLSNINSNSLSANDLQSLKASWQSITNNWMTSSLNLSEVDKSRYLFLTPIEDSYSKIEQEIQSINDIISSMFHLSFNSNQIQSQLMQIVYNSHSSRVNIISNLISNISNNLAHVNPWTIVGDITSSVITDSLDLGADVFKLVTHMLSDILTGVSKLTAPGSLIYNIFNDVNEFIMNGVPTYPFIPNDNNTLFFSQSIVEGNTTLPNIYGVNPITGKMVQSYKDLTSMSFDIFNNRLACQINGVDYFIYNAKPNSITKTSFFTPHGIVDLWIDTINWFNPNGTIEKINYDTNEPANANIIMLVPRPDKGKHGLLNVNKSISKYLWTVCDLSYIYNVGVGSKNNPFNSIKATITSIPGFSNFTPRMSMTEFALIETADSVAAAAYTTKAILDAVSFNFSGVTSSTIEAGEMVANAFYYANLYSQEEVANISTAFNTYLNSVESNILSAISEIWVTSFVSINLLTNPFIVESMTSISDGFNSSNYVPYYNHISNLEIFEQISMSMAKFAISNYVQNKALHSMYKFVNNQKDYDSKSARIKPYSKWSTIADTVGIKLILNKISRSKSNESRVNEINDQTGQIGNGLNAVTSTISQEVSSVGDTIVTTMSKIRGLN